MEFDFSIKLKPIRLEETARRFAQRALQQLAPDVETGRLVLAAKSLHGLFLETNMTAFCSQITNELQGGEDLMGLFHPRTTIDGRSNDFKPEEAKAVYEALQKATKWPQFLRWGEQKTILEVADDPYRYIIPGIAPKELAAFLSPVVNACKQLHEDETANAKTVYNTLSWAISTNLLGTLRPNLLMYHSGMNFVASLTAVMTDVQGGRYHKGMLELALGYGRQLLLSLETGNC